jgi:hypothetical protein
VILLESCTTQPAPLVLTFWTSHVVAALIGYLSDPSLAHSTVNYVTFSFGPFAVVQIFCVVACQAFVFRSSAVKANLSLAFRTDFTCLVNRGSTVRRRTPF